jgi:hypothetical protein
MNPILIGGVIAIIVVAVLLAVIIIIVLLISKKKGGARPPPPAAAAPAPSEGEQKPEKEEVQVDQGEIDKFMEMFSQTGEAPPPEPAEGEVSPFEGVDPQAEPKRRFAEAKDEIIQKIKENKIPQERIVEIMNDVNMAIENNDYQRGTEIIRNELDSEMEMMDIDDPYSQTL